MMTLQLPTKLSHPVQRGVAYGGFFESSTIEYTYCYCRGVVVFWPRGGFSIRVDQSTGIPYMLSYLSVALPLEVYEIAGQIIKIL